MRPPAKARALLLSCAAIAALAAASPAPAQAPARLEVERLFDHENTLIFAFPDPGRRVRLTVRLREGPRRPDTP